MNSLILKISLLKSKNSKKDKNFRYRYQKLLNSPLQNFPFASWLKSKADEELLEIMSMHHPLEARDLPVYIQKKFTIWIKKLPRDRKFYQMVYEQLELFRRFRGRSLNEFFDSPEGIEWIKARKRLKRKAHFELDRSFKKTKQSAETNTRVIRNLLRAYPTLSMDDLKKLGLKNVQAAFEGFRFHDDYHQRFLLDLKRRLPSFE